MVRLLAWSCGTEHRDGFSRTFDEDGPSPVPNGQNPLEKEDR